MDRIETYLKELKPEYREIAVHRLLGALSAVVTDSQAEQAIRVASSRPYYNLSVSPSVGEYQKV